MQQEKFDELFYLTILLAKHHFPTLMHCYRVGAIAELTMPGIYGENELTPQEALLAGYLHDFGKRLVPREILQSQNRMTQEGIEMMKQHPRISVEMAKTLGASKIVQYIIGGHHEPEYPRTGGEYNGIERREYTNPELLQKIQVIDTIDALTDPRRNYREAISLAEASKTAQTRFPQQESFINEVVRTVEQLKQTEILFT